MKNISKNLCIRCGKQRVIVRTYQEEVGTATLTRTETACPDPDCQEKVDKMLSDEKQKRLKAIESSNQFHSAKKPVKFTAK